MLKRIKLLKTLKYSVSQLGPVFHCFTAKHGKQSSSCLAYVKDEHV